MEADHWSRWVEGRAFGDDETQQRAHAARLATYRERVLAGAHLAASDTLLDVGAGDGLIGFGALRELGPDGRVIFSDVSEPLLRTCHRRAAELGELERTGFLRASADELGEVGSSSVDVVSTRSVLIYLPLRRKRAALREFHRVLRPGGRISLFEPINAWFGASEPSHRLLGFDVGPVRGLAGKVKSEYERVRPASDSPLMDFDEHDLLSAALDAGFDPVELDLVATVESGSPITGWDALLAFAGNPLEPTFGEMLDAALDAKERDSLAAHLRPLAEAGEGERRTAVTFMTGSKRS